MKALKISIVVGLIAGAVLAQTRTDVFNAANIKVDEIILTPLADGGCSARWGGNIVSTDGGNNIVAVTESLELKNTTNQNRCAALASAGHGRLLKVMRLADDAGTP